MIKKSIYELYWLRSIACLCVVMVHTITRVIEINGSNLLLLDIRLLLTFGTPIFIMLSEFLLAYKSPVGLSSGFYKKRIQYLLLPYISMAFLYAIIMCYENNVNVFSLNYFAYVSRNLLFGFYRHGYFLLVIFQFYVLHQFFSKKLSAYPPFKTIFLALFFNVLYLGFFNFINPDSIIFGPLIWRALSWGFFPAWVFYFVLGYYMAIYFDNLKTVLKKYRLYIFLATALSGLMVLTIYHKGWITINESKRIDMLLFSPLATFSILSLPIKKSAVIESFSTYTFVIYLYHMFFLSLLTRFLSNQSTFVIGNSFLLIFLFSFSTVASMLVVHFFKDFKWGYVLIGSFKNYPLKKHK